MWRIWRKRTKQTEIHPDEILIDSQSASNFDRDQFEGRIERPLSRRSLTAAGALLGLFFALLLLRAGELQVVRGAAYAKQAEENQLSEVVLIADRGVLLDREGRELAWNERVSVADDFAVRAYAEYAGLAHAVGYVQPPAKDSAGFYYRDTHIGVDGAELAFDERLTGQNGLKLTETDARGEVVSEAVVRAAVPGARLVLSLDAEVTEELHRVLGKRAAEARAQGAAGIIMNVQTGELLAMTSYPEYDPEVLLTGDASAIAAYSADRRLPFLNRATDGLYTPGSIVKPVMAAAALQEGTINEYKQILSTGSISVPNPYDPSKPTIFRDWRGNG